MSTLDEDLAFSIPHMRRLQELGIKAMEVAEETAIEEEASLQRLKEAIKDLPPEVYTGDLQASIERVEGTLVSDLYGIARNELRSTIDDLVETIPRIDRESAERMEELTERGKQIGHQLDAVMELLGEGNRNLTHQGFSGRLMQLNLIGQPSDGLISLSNVAIIDGLTGKSNDEIWELWKKRKSATTKLQEDLDEWFQSQPWSELDRRFTKDFNFTVDRSREG